MVEVRTEFGHKRLKPPPDLPIPVVRATARGSPACPGPSRPNPTKGAKREVAILVVDDSRAMRMIVRRELRKAGYRAVVEAENGVVALQEMRDGVEWHNTSTVDVDGYPSGRLGFLAP